MSTEPQEEAERETNLIDMISDLLMRVTGLEKEVRELRADQHRKNILDIEAFYQELTKRMALDVRKR